MQWHIFTALLETKEYIFPPYNMMDFNFIKNEYNIEKVIQNVQEEV